MFIYLNYYTDEEVDNCGAREEDYLQRIDKEKLDKTIRISIAVILTIIILMLTLLLYCFSKR